MKNWYKVTIKATITKTQDIEAVSQEAAEQEAMELFNPHSGEAEECYTQEVVSVQEVSEDPETEQLEILEAAWYAIRHHFDELAYYLDLSDESMEELRANVRSKIDAQLEEK